MADSDSTTPDPGGGGAPSPEEAKKKAKKANLVRELLDTEENYVNDLKLVIEVFLQPLRKMDSLTKKDLASIFSNIEAVIEVNEPFLKDLKAHLDGDHIGEAFLKQADLFKIYAVYCSNQPRINPTVKSLSAKIPQFGAFLDSKINEPRCRFLGLEDFLIMPMQRICKYPLLLGSLEQVTSGKEAELIHQAIDKIKGIIALINERTKRVERIEQLSAVQSRLILDPNEVFDLVIEKRRFLGEGKLKYKKDSYDNPYAFLFDDMLLLCAKEPTGTMMTKKRVISFSGMADVTIVDLEAGQEDTPEPTTGSGGLERRKSSGLKSKAELGKETLELKVLKVADGKIEEKVWRLKTFSKVEKDMWLKKLQDLSVLRRRRSYRNQPVPVSAARTPEMAQTFNPGLIRRDALTNLKNSQPGGAPSAAETGLVLPTQPGPSTFEIGQISPKTRAGIMMGASRSRDRSSNTRLERMRSTSSLPKVSPRGTVTDAAPEDPETPQDGDVPSPRRASLMRMKSESNKSRLIQATTEIFSPRGQLSPRKMSMATLPSRPPPPEPAPDEPSPVTNSEKDRVKRSASTDGKFKRKVSKKSPSTSPNASMVALPEFLKTPEKKATPSKKENRKSWAGHVDLGPEFLAQTPPSMIRFNLNVGGPQPLPPINWETLAKRVEESLKLSPSGRKMLSARSQTTVGIPGVQKGTHNSPAQASPRFKKPTTGACSLPEEQMHPRVSSDKTSDKDKSSDKERKAKIKRKRTKSGEKSALDALGDAVTRGSSEINKRKPSSAKLKHKSAKTLAPLSTVAEGMDAAAEGPSKTTE